MVLRERITGKPEGPNEMLIDFSTQGGLIRGIQLRQFGSVIVEARFDYDAGGTY